MVVVEAEQRRLPLLKVGITVFTKLPSLPVAAYYQDPNHAACIVAVLAKQSNRARE